jgi:hypothetical protein
MPLARLNISSSKPWRTIDKKRIYETVVSASKQRSKERKGRFGRLRKPPSKRQQYNICSLAFGERGNDERCRIYGEVKNSKNRAN